MARKAKAVKVNSHEDKDIVQVKTVQVKAKQVQSETQKKQTRHAPLNSSVRRKDAKNNAAEKTESCVVFTDEAACAQREQERQTAAQTEDTQKAELTREKPAVQTDDKAEQPVEFVPPEPVECLSYFDDPNVNKKAEQPQAESEPPKTAQQRREERRAKREEQRRQRDRHASDVLEEHKEKVREELLEAEKNALKVAKKKAEQRLAKQEQRRQKKEKLQESIAAVGATGLELAKAGGEKLTETTESITKMAKAGKKKLMTDKEVEPDADRSLQKWKDISLPRKIIMALSVLLAGYALSPLLFGAVILGMIPPLCIAIFCFLTAWLWNKITTQRKWYINLLYKLAALLIMCGIVIMAFISGKMVSASTHTPPKDNSEVTVIVLGCLIKGDQPSLMLRDRLDTAAAYLKEHPGAYCIVTGGQGDNEDYPEAVIMKKYLTEKGVSDRRILAETSSTSTKENINNAGTLIKGCGLYDRVVIVSDRFHQYRARCLAEEAGFDYIYALNTETRLYLAMPYWFREMVCIVRDWIQGREAK